MTWHRPAFAPEKIVTSFPARTDEELDAILHTAHATDRNDWRPRSHANRAIILARAASILDEPAADFAWRRWYDTRYMGNLLPGQRR
jgi:acyl-CoA reductase-like NAD-dependent aldehyde dehydrogenase